MNKLLVIAMTSAIATNAFSYSGSNDPKFFDAEGVYNHRLSSLPMSGNLAAYMAPWASSFWPHIYGGIAFRWNDSIEDAPVVRKLQAQIGGLKDEYKALKKELFSKTNPSDREVTITGNKIQDAKDEIKQLLILKGAEHQKVFFDIKRP